MKIFSYLPADATRASRSGEGTMDIDYTFTFSGEKIKKHTTGNEDDAEERIYLGGVEYKDDVAEHYNHGDGRIVLKEEKIEFQYKIVDHLGNTVVLFADTNDDGEITETSTPASEVLQRNLYYPFGMALEGTWNASTTPSMDYLYNGKELANDLDLDWQFYGFRMYDAAVGRFTGVDPIADEFAFVSTFNYAENSPVRYIDLWGLQKTLPEGTGPWSNEYYNEVIETQKFIDKYNSSDTDYNHHELLINPEKFYNKARKGDVLPDGTVVEGVNEASGWATLQMGLTVYDYMSGRIFIGPNQLPSNQGINIKTPPVIKKLGYKSPLPSRHSATKVNQKSRVKNQNTVYDKTVDVQADVSTINKGQFTKVGENLVLNNGRQYTLHNDHSTRQN